MLAPYYGHSITLHIIWNGIFVLKTYIIGLYLKSYILLRRVWRMDGQLSLSFSFPPDLSHSGTQRYKLELIFSSSKRYLIIWFRQQYEYFQCWKLSSDYTYSLNGPQVNLDFLGRKAVKLNNDFPSALI